MRLTSAALLAALEISNGRDHRKFDPQIPQTSLVVLSKMNIASGIRNSVCIRGKKVLLSELDDNKM